MANASIELPLDKVRGTEILVAVDARVQDISKPEHPWNGIKAMLHVKSPTTSDSWNAAAGNLDESPFSYDWKRLTFRSTIPANASSATLILGIEEASGTADFRNPTVTIVRKVFNIWAPNKLSEHATPVYTGHGPGSLRGVMILPRTFQRADVDTLKRWHVNLVRWQLNDTVHVSDMSIEDYDRWLYLMLAHLDEMLPALNKAGIIVLVDLHVAPGGSDEHSTTRIFTDAGLQKHFSLVWSRIAERYKGDKRIWGYDLLNEPILPNTLPDGVLGWRALAEKTARTVRAIDRDHAIIIEPDPWANPNALEAFDPIDVPGIVYSVHMYEPHIFTHQGVQDAVPVGPRYPGIIGGEQWDKERVRKELSTVVAYAKATHSQIYVGEFSAIRWAKGADQYISDVIDVMEENHWDWSYHAFREWQGWSPEVGEDKDVATPSPTPTARLLVLQRAFAKNANGR